MTRGFYDRTATERPYRVGIARCQERYLCRDPPAVVSVATEPAFARASDILDKSRMVRHIGHMDVRSMGRLISQHRRAQGFTSRQLAARAKVGRSTLAALESGKLEEIGFVKVNRILAALGLVIDVREPVLSAPLMGHRHLTEQAGRELTKAAIEDVITRGEIEAWRGLVKAVRDDKTGRIARRAGEVAKALSKEDGKARAFAALLPRFEPKVRPRRHARA